MDQKNCGLKAINLFDAVVGHVHGDLAGPFFRDRFTSGPMDAVDNQALEGLLVKIFRVAHGGHEHLSAKGICAGPGHRVIIGSGLIGVYRFAH